MDEKQILKNENFSRDLRASTDSKHDAESDQKSWRICLLQVSGAELIKTIVGEWRFEEHYTRAGASINCQLQPKPIVKERRA